MKKVAIIGGGAAGMMCTAALVEKNFEGEIVLFERNKQLGEKVIISGGGRCNVTTGICEVDRLLPYYIRGDQFLKQSLEVFGPCRIRSWFEHHNVPCKEEKNHRIFPVSDDGQDIVGVFESLIDRNKAVRVRYNTSVKEITHSDNSFIITSDDQENEKFDYVVITTGGNAYAHTGSQGDGYAFARALGHTITQCSPSLSSFEVEETWISELSGLTLPDAKLIVDEKDGKNLYVIGGLIFTHFGISGPVTFSLSSHLAHVEISPDKMQKVHLVVDASRNADDWDALLRKDFDKDGSKYVRTILAQHVSKRLVDFICVESNIDSTLKAAQMSKKMRHDLVDTLSNGIEIHLKKRRSGDEFVTAGGVSLDEVDPQTCESRITPGLYFAGEVLDVDGLTGGFNLTSSWATGHVVGRAIS